MSVMLRRSSTKILVFVPVGLSLASFACSTDPLTCENPPCISDGAGGTGAGGSTGDAGSGPVGDISAAVPHYDYTFDLTSAEGSSRLTLDVAPPGGDCWSVNSELAPLTDLTWNDMPVISSTLEGGVLRTCGPSTPGGFPLAVGSKGTVPMVKYFGLDVGFSRRKDLGGGEFSYLLSWVGGCDKFGPCDDDPSRLASFHFEVTHPAGTTVLCPGTLTKTDTRTTCDVSGAPTYSAFAIAADPLWERAPLGTFAGVDVVFYETPVGGLASSLDKASVGAFLDWITSQLGPFPYGKELRVAGGPTVWLGFEHPANIILQEQLDKLQLDYQNGTMHVLMHEIVHQWAGDRSTLASASDFVWKEATAEYLAYVFEDEARPAGEAAATRKYWDSIWSFSKNYPRPTDDPAPEVQTFYGDVYGPGPMVLYLQLEALIGRPAVLSGIKTFLSVPGARSVTELKDALGTAAGKDLTAYFDAWVFGKGAPEWPTFAVAATQAGGEATVTVAQQNPSGKLYGCVVEVEVQGATQKARALVDFGVAPQNAKLTTTVPFPEPVTAVVLDPDNKLIGKKSGQAPLSAPRPVWIF